MIVNVKRVKSKKELEQAVEDAQIEGWKLKNRGDKVIVLQKPGELGGIIAHTIIFIIFGWWTFLLGNLVYAAYKYFSGMQELRIKRR